MNLRFFDKRVVLFPTFLGWLLIFALSASTLLLWWYRGEPFLSCTLRLPAEVLVVEGWIGPKGIREASREFEQGGYQYVVATGGLSEERWNQSSWSFAAEAAKILLKEGVPRDRLVDAPPYITEGQRTYEEAEAVYRAMRDRNIHPRAINVFTMGVHARRSRSVFTKVFRPSTEVGVIAWAPNDYRSEAWWHSSERAGAFLKETVAYFFETVLNSGRGFHALPGSVQRESLPNK